MKAGSGVVDARPVLGAAAILANTALVPIIGVSVKMLAAEGVASVEVLAGRGALTFALLLPLLVFARHRRAVRTTDLRAHLVHVAFAVSTMACIYYALRSLPLVTVTAVNFTTPIFTVLLAGLLFGDRIAPLGWAALMIGFIGTLIVLRPEATGVGLDVILLITGSVLAAGMNIAVRRMPAHSTNYAVVFYFSFACAVVFGLAGAGSATLPTPTEAMWFLILSATAIGVHTFLAVAYRYASSVLVGALDYGRIIGAAVLGWIFFGEVPDVFDAAGIALIIFSGAIVLRLSTRDAPPRTTA